jgi:hypothetical protein
MTTLPVVTVTVTVAGMYKSECGMLLEGGKKGDETRQAEESPPNSKPAGQGPGLFQWAGMKEGGLGLLGRLRLEWEGPSIGGGGARSVSLGAPGLFETGLQATGRPSDALPSIFCREGV